MYYYLEIWLRDSLKDELRNLSSKDSEKYHPHVTLVRPFYIKTSEKEVKDKITSFCQGMKPVPFKIEGKSNFGELNFVPVKSKELTEFDQGLEKTLEESVDFFKKLNKKKIFHITVGKENKNFSFPLQKQYMLRLTAMKRDKIWFSYDFVTQRILNREESLDKEKWQKTKEIFSKLEIKN